MTTFITALHIERLLISWEHGTEEDYIRDMQVQVKAEYMTDYTRQQSSLSEFQTISEVN
jgi:hypothetical protein